METTRGFRTIFAGRQFRRDEVTWDYIELVEPGSGPGR
jgi:hypothetical protein